MSNSQSSSVLGEANAFQKLGSVENRLFATQSYGGGHVPPPPSNTDLYFKEQEAAAQYKLLARAEREFFR